MESVRERTSKDEPPLSHYQIVDRKDNKGFARHLAKNGQLFLPLVELIETSRLAVDELIAVLGRATILRE